MRKWMNNLAAIIFGFALLAGCGSDGGTGSSDGSTSSPALPACGSDALFTVSPVSTSVITNIYPLGNVNPSGHVFPTSHLYFVPSAETTVYAPGDITIDTITLQKNLTAGTNDYTMTFQPCSEFKGYFYHIDSLSQALSLEAGSFDDCDDAYTTGGATYQLCSKTVDISLSAGDEIGTVDGTFDFGAYDSRIDALDYANPDRFWTAEDGFDKLHLVCAIDYFSSGVKGALEALLGGKTPGGGPFAYRTAAPLCGEVEQDAAGTAQGIWFVEGTTGTFQQEDAHLALIHNNVDPTIPEFSVGTSFSNWDSGTYVFSIQNSGLKNRDFDDVTADGNTYCYESISYASGGTAIGSMMIVLQMTGATTLRIERQSSSSCGDGPWTFGSNYVDFER